MRESVLSLPPLARRYFERAVGDPERLPRRVRLTQVGEMQQKPGRWLPFQATETLEVDGVEFAWHASFPLVPFVDLRVNDWYRAGEGGIDGRLWGVVPVLRGSGPAFARGEAMRYLSELPWVPQAIVGNRSLEWREVDEETLEVSTRAGTADAPVRLQFDTAGDIVVASAAARPRMVGKRTVETPWRGCFGGYAELGGLRVPTRAEVEWDLPDGPFVYFRGTVTALELED